MLKPGHQLPAKSNDGQASYLDTKSGTEILRYSSTSYRETFDPVAHTNKGHKLSDGARVRETELM